MFYLFFLLFNFYSSFIFVFFLRFLWVYLLQTLMRPHSSTWVTKGFKELVAYAKCNRDSYDCELDLKIMFFALLEDEQSLSVEVFVWVLT